MKTKQLPSDFMERDPHLEELLEDVRRTLERNEAIIARVDRKAERFERWMRESEETSERAFRRLREALLLVR